MDDDRLFIAVTVIVLAVTALAAWEMLPDLFRLACR